MTKIKLTLITVLFAVLHSGCTAISEVGTTRLKCFQAIESCKDVSYGLYRTDRTYDVSEPILLISFKNHCTGREAIVQYDGFVYHGPLKDIGTYEYTTVGNEKEGIKSRRKIVRAVMPLWEYKDMCKCNRDHLYKLLDMVLERNKS